MDRRVFLVLLLAGCADTSANAPLAPSITPAKPPAVPPPAPAAPTADPGLRPGRGLRHLAGRLQAEGPGRRPDPAAAGPRTGRPDAQSQVISAGQPPAGVLQAGRRLYQGRHQRRPRRRGPTASARAWPSCPAIEQPLRRAARHPDRPSGPWNRRSASIQGDFDVVRSMATLAAHGRRRGLGRGRADRRPEDHRVGRGHPRAS